MSAGLLLRVMPLTVAPADAVAQECVLRQCRRRYLESVAVAFTCAVGIAVFIGNAVFDENGADQPVSP